MAQAMIITQQTAVAATNQQPAAACQVAMHALTCEASEVTWVDLMKSNMIGTAEDIIACLSLARALKMHRVSKKIGTYSCKLNAQLISMFLCT